MGCLQPTNSPQGMLHREPPGPRFFQKSAAQSCGFFFVGRPPSRPQSQPVQAQWAGPWRMGSLVVGYVVIGSPPPHGETP